jgi:DNA polymerase phi
MVPQMLEEVEAEIEELKIVFQNLGLASSDEQGKRSKKKADQTEALDILVDFLISLLTKPQSFLRDIANFTFKQFCTQISPKALSNLAKIILTPNSEANKMLFGEDEIEDLDDEEDGEDEDEGDDESDDDSD